MGWDFVYKVIPRFLGKAVELAEDISDREHGRVKAFGICRDIRGYRATEAVEFDDIKVLDFAEMEKVIKGLSEKCKLDGVFVSGNTIFTGDSIYETGVMVENGVKAVCLLKKHYETDRYYIRDKPKYNVYCAAVESDVAQSEGIREMLSQLRKKPDYDLEELKEKVDIFEERDDDFITMKAFISRSKK